MNIYLNNQQFCIHDINVLTISSSSSLQVGDTETVVLTSYSEDVPDSHHYGAFPIAITPMKFNTSSNRVKNGDQKNEQASME